MLHDKKSKYKYWQMYKMMAKRGYNDLLGASQLWTNLIPVDYHGHSYLGTGRALQYDKDLYSFLHIDSKHTVSLRKLPECAAKEEGSIDLTDTITFMWNDIRCIRTEHPRKLESRETKCVKKIVVDTVYNLIESEG